MFAVLETETVPRRFCLWRAAVTAGERELPHYLCVTLEVPIGARIKDMRGRVVRAFRYISRAGIKGIVLPPAFPYAALAETFGLTVSSPVPLLRRMAAAMCRHAAETAGVPWERIRLSLISRRSTPELLNTAQTLASEARAVHIAAGEDSEAVCYLLRSQYGVSASAHPVKHSEGFFDIFIIYEAPPQKLPVPDGALVLNLAGGVPALSGGRAADGALLEPPRSLLREWPEGCDNAAMLAALVAEGQLSPAEITVRGLTLGGLPV
ncbi:MAG: hypothetical protein LBR76_08710 [Oscillospiraceae bacterium]|nr:hypothetical protein [Oscillospiraceae bacterium]